MEWFMNWWWATIIGPIILIGVIAYAMSRERRLSPREQEEQIEAVDRVYDEEEGRKEEHRRARGR